MCRFGLGLTALETRAGMLPVASWQKRIEVYGGECLGLTVFQSGGVSRPWSIKKRQREGNEFRRFAVAMRPTMRNLSGDIVVQLSKSQIRNAGPPAGFLSSAGQARVCRSLVCRPCRASCGLRNRAMETETICRLWMALAGRSWACSAKRVLKPGDELSKN